MAQPLLPRIPAVVALASALAGCGLPRATLVASGRFESSVSGPTGEVAIYRADGALTLRLRDVRPATGLEVRLVGAGEEPSTGFLVVGRLETDASLAFELPPCTDVTRYRAVAIWDRARQLTRATAPLVHRSPGGPVP